MKESFSFSYTFPVGIINLTNLRPLLRKIIFKGIVFSGDTGFLTYRVIASSRDLTVYSSSELMIQV